MNLKRDRGLINHKLRIKHEKRGRRNYNDQMMVSLGFSSKNLMIFSQVFKSSSQPPPWSQSVDKVPFSEPSPPPLSSLSSLSLKTLHYGLKMGKKSNQNRPRTSRRRLATSRRRFCSSLQRRDVGSHVATLLQLSCFCSNFVRP